MIKGVNRQFIEVCDTGSKYFERALLVVRPEFTVSSQEKLKSEAKRMLSEMEPESFRKEQHGKLRRAALIKRRRKMRLLTLIFMCALSLAAGLIISRVI